MGFQLDISFSLSYWPKTLVTETVEFGCTNQSAKFTVAEVYNQKPTVSLAIIQKALQGTFYLWNFSFFLNWAEIILFTLCFNIFAFAAHSLTRLKSTSIYWKQNVC